MSRYYCGVDLGQVSDYTALVILQCEDRPAGDPPRYLARWAERFPLSTPYPSICDLLAARLRPLSAWQPYLVVDATGPGLAVTDLMRSRGLELTAVTITGGTEQSEGEASVHLPKRQLVGGLSVALQTGKVLIARDLPHGTELKRELLDFQVKFGRAGLERYEARRSAVHDDLAIALMLALWRARRQEERGQIQGLFEYLRNRARLGAPSTKG